MLAIEVRHLELGIVTALTAALAAAALGLPPSPCAPQAQSPASMPAPAPEPVALRDTHTTAISCDAPDITTIVFRGEVTSLHPDQMATFHFRFADLPSRYLVMTGASGAFEVRVPREELGVVDLCSLPSSGQRPTSFADGSMTIRYELAFER